jgi:hypothetical protein
VSIVSVITDPGVGGTFLTWSLEWLSGANNYFFVKSNNFEPLPNNPLTGINAHKFQLNQPTTLAQLKTCYNKLEITPTSYQHFVYFHNLENEDLSYPPDPLLDKAATEIAFAKSKKCIFLKLAARDCLYKIGVCGRTLTHKFNSSQKNQTFDEQNEDFIDFFYAADKKYWRDVLEATEIWDHREFLALNLQPFDQVTFNQDHLTGRRYFLLNAVDCHLTLEHTMSSVFDYLEIGMDQTRWHHWVSVYKQWQRLHVPRLKFAWYFQDIINAVIRGDNFDLDQFNLDLYQEAAIQHELLYKHNLNLKTYQITKFHSTSQLHDLLEPNIHHILEKIY